MDADRMMALAEQVVAGSGIDWGAEAESSGDEKEQKVIRSMGLLARIADVHAEGASAHDLPTIDAVPVDPAAIEMPVSRRWGHFEKLQYIGRGAFGIVCKAWDPKLEIWVALKLSRLGVEHSSRTEAMLEEARLMARVRHENVVRIYGTDVHDGRAGIWMEFIEGRTLDEIVKFEGQLSSRQATEIGRKLALAVAAVHGQGIIHKDIKAHNVMRESGGRLVLMDFGASLRADELRDELDVGPVRGTPYYLAPELLNDSAPSVQSDIYSLGVLLFYLLTARYPVEADSFPALVEAHRQGRRRSLVDLRPELDRSLHRVVERALHPEPAQRYESAGRMARELESRRRDPVPWIIATTLTIGLGIFGGWLIYKELSSFVVGASLYRAGPTSQELRSGSRVTPGDQLYLELETTKPLHVYVLNQDDNGVAALLFPIPGLPLQNPISAHQAHDLPGTLDARQVYWVVTSRGERERFWIVASRKPIPELEKLIDELPAAGFGNQVTYPTLDEPTLRSVRGITGLASAKGLALAEEGSTNPAQEDFFSRLAELTDEKEKQRDVWVRRIELENPSSADSPRRGANPRDSSP